MFVCLQEMSALHTTTPTRHPHPTPWATMYFAEISVILRMHVHPSPVAYNIAWEAPWLLGWVIRLLYLFRPVTHTNRHLDHSHTPCSVYLGDVAEDKVLGTSWDG